MLTKFLAFVLGMGLIIIGFPFALLGIGGLSGALPESTRDESMQMGLLYSVVAATAWGMSLTLSWWVNGHKVPTQFSMRALMVGFTLAAAMMGLLAIQSS